MFLEFNDLPFYATQIINPFQNSIMKNGEILSHLIVIVQVFIKISKSPYLNV